MEEPTNIQLRKLESNPFIRPSNSGESLVFYISSYDYFLKKAWYKGQLYKYDSTPYLRKLRTLNV